MRAVLNHKRSPINVSITFQSLNNEPDIASAQDALHEVLPTQDVFGQSSTTGISESNTVHSEQPKLNTCEGEQAQQSFGSADANTGSINDTQQNRSSTVNQEPLNMDMSGSDDTVPVDEKNAGKAEKLFRVQLTLVFMNMVFTEFLNISNKKSRSLQFG